MTNPSRRSFLVGTGASAAGLLAGTPPGARAEAQAPAAAPIPAVQPGNWDSVRRQFNLDPNLTHLVAFFMNSHPAPVRAAIDRFRVELDRNPFTYWNREHPIQNRRVKDAAAAYIGGRHEDVTLVQSTSMGIATIYHGLRLGPNDEILQTNNEHYCQHESARYVCERTGATFRKFRLYNGLEALPRITEGQIVDRIRKEISPQTRILGMTWVQSDSGLRMPLQAIADVLRRINRDRPNERHHVRMVVDGIHGFGAVDERVIDTGSDYFASGTHKWIFGPRGTGIVWARAQLWGPMRPWVPTFDNPEPHERWRTSRTPNEVEQASSFNPGGFHSMEHEWAVTDAFAFIDSIGGRTMIANRVHELNGQLKQRLAEIARVRVWTPMEPSLSAGMLAFDIDGIDPRDVVRRMLERRIVASASPYARLTVRLSAGVMNNTDDIDRAIAAVRAIAQAG